MARRSRGTTSDEPVSLGSLTQVPTDVLVRCHACASTRVTRIAMQLTDGTPVDFTACQNCETRSWVSGGVALDFADVLARTRKPA
jgi:hypothetical protein